MPSATLGIHTKEWPRVGDYGKFTSICGDWRSHHREHILEKEHWLIGGISVGENMKSRREN